ncbi:MAG TPA: hypothetical protein VJU82_05965 [Acidobacteriaceae bacterium]|nr:hypothetical protein [Acidobacteriaceae bacterium]
MKTKKVQIVSMAISALFLPFFILEGTLIWSSKFVAASFLVVLYACVLAALLSTFLRYRTEQRTLLPHWRRMSYITGVLGLLVFSLLPLATWPIGLSGATLHLRSTVLCLLAVNAVAAIPCLVRKRLVTAGTDSRGILGDVSVDDPAWDARLTGRTEIVLLAATRPFQIFIGPERREIDED